MEQRLDNNIAQTGYRTLFILQLLIKGPIKKAQILEKISQNPYLKNVTSDTIRLDINTLKSAGFDIKSGNKGNNYCYELKFAPIKIKLLKKEKRAICLAKKAMFDFLDFREIIALYESLEKISKLIEPKEDTDEILDFGNFLRTDFQMVKLLDLHCKIQNEIEILYDSPSIQNRKMKVTALYLNYSKKSDKLYLWCNCEEYGGIIYLRVDRIKEISKVCDYSKAPKIKTKECVYRVSRNLKSPFELEEYEKIIRITPSFIEVNANYYNEFNFVQRLLRYGADLLYVGGKDVKNKIIEELKLICGVYK